MATLNTITFALRVASILLALVELGVTVYVVYYSDDYFYEDPYGDWGVNHNTPSQIGFLLFASIWSLLALVYTTLASVYFIRGGESSSRVSSNARYRNAITIVDAVTAVFWLAGWIAMAKLIGGPSTCTSFCAAVQASVAFAAFLWAAFSASAVIGMWQLWKKWQGVGNKADRAEEGHRAWVGGSSQLGTL